MKSMFRISGLVNALLTLAITGFNANAYDDYLYANKGIKTRLNSYGTALEVHGAEAIYFNGTNFSWGYGGTWNRFADPVRIGSGNAVPSGCKLAVDGAVNINSNGALLTGPGNAEAVYYNGTYFSWGFGGTWNRFADPVRIGSGNPVPSGCKLAVDGTVNVNSNVLLTGAGNAEAVWYNGDHFSWGFGGDYNFFADPIKIGADNPVPNGCRLAVTGNASVNGTITAKEVVVTQRNWPDYVLKNDYNLLDIEKVDAFIKENGHLPKIPSGKQIEENGANIGEVQKCMMEKIEELTLYVIQLNKTVKEQQAKIEELSNGR